MAVYLYNDGKTIRVVEGTITRNIDKPYTVTINSEASEMSIRNELTAVSFRYADVVVPTSTSLENLRSIVEGWLESSIGLTTSPFSLVNSDIAGQVASASATPFGDYRFTEDLRPQFFSQLKNATGDIAYYSTSGNVGAKLSVAANGDYAVFGSYQNHPYYAGFPIAFEFTCLGFDPETNVEKEICYGDRTASTFSTGRDMFRFVAKDGTHYLEWYRSGTQVYSAARADWTDPFDGTGVSGINLGDFSTFCVFEMQFLWLGGAGVAFFAYANGTKYLLHLIPWSFSETGLIITNPQKPVQAGIISTDTDGVGDFVFVCSTVKTLGEPNITQGDDLNLYTGTTNNSLASTGTVNALLGVKLKAGYKNGYVIPSEVEVASEGASDAFRWTLRINPTVTGTFVYGDVTDSCIQYAAVNGGTLPTVTGGRAIAGGQGVGRSSLVNAINSARRIGWALDGTADTMVVCAENLTAGAVNVNASMTIKMKY